MNSIGLQEVSFAHFRALFVQSQRGTEEDHVIMVGSMAGIQTEYFMEIFQK
jgi:2-hydroxychromene-2-carboxylate isomerase